MSRLPKPAHILEYLLLRVAFTVILCLGFRRAVRVARGGADIIYRLNAKYRLRAIENLEHAFPALAPEEWDRIARASFRSFATTFIETTYFDRILPPHKVKEDYRIEYHPATEEAIRQGRGAIFVTAHIGNWELTGLVAGAYGTPLVSVARPFANPLLNKYLTSQRERRGQKIVMKRGAIRGLARTLREGGYLGIMSDQNAGRHGVFVDFFGRKASTIGMPATLAIKYDVPIISAWQYRESPFGPHRLIAEAPIENPSTGDRTEDIRIMTQEMASRVESWVRQKPGQWLWGHRRWKTRPKEEKACPPSPSNSTA